MTLDLNQAMVEMYKQRRENKRPKVEQIALNKDFIPKSTFEQLFGCDSIRDRIIMIIKRFTKSIEGKSKKFRRPILIFGSSGLGKTSIVEGAANYAKLKLILINLKKLSKKTKIDFQMSLEQLSSYCIANQPSIVLIDDLDKLNGKEDKIDLLAEILDKLLVEELDILVFCTTSKILDEHWDLKFHLSIDLKRPDADARFKILESLMKKDNNLKQLSEESLKTIANNTPSFSPLDLEEMFDVAQTESQGSFVTLENCLASIDIIKQSFKQGTHLIGEKPNTTWNDIGGMSKVRETFIDILREINIGDVDCQFAGILLYGPPGCGKTMVARAMANEAGLNFISINPTELQNKFFGETERNIRKVFREAREYEPCVIYFDEFDGLCGSRGRKDNMTSAIQTLLSEMDGFASRGKSIILASTNRLEDIDFAMKRPGRLSKHIYIGRPNETDRKDILMVLVNKRNIKLFNDVDLNDWAKKTKNFTGADLAYLINEAKLKGYSESINSNDGDTILIKQRHLEDALKKIRNKNKHEDDL